MGTWANADGHHMCIPAQHPICMSPRHTQYTSNLPHRIWEGLQASAREAALFAFVEGTLAFLVDGLVGVAHCLPASDEFIVELVRRLACLRLRQVDGSPMDHVGLL
eukprot:m.39226 g.39226  ORF g.39226 m.39226 type:complete len:106 (+) comp10289_c0_seq2:2017-2334(+)